MNLLGIAKRTTFASLLLTIPAVAQGEIPADTEVITTESGLKYSVLKKGTGDRNPGATETVRVHYTGWLTDGTKFDSSRDRGQPATFPLNGVIAGWTEGVQLMTVGARFKFTIPWALAYGENGRPPQIPAKADLIFDIELLSLAPDLPAMEEGKTKKTESGIEYMAITEGSGPSWTEGDIYELEFAIFGPDGSYQDGTWRRNGQTLPPRAIENIKFLKELAPMMKVGDSWRVVVPAGMGAGMRGPSASEDWVITLKGLKKPEPMPEFQLPEDSELTTTDSGLKYKVLERGDENGISPKMREYVTVHYAGWLTDGTSFDSSYSRGDTSSFMLGQVIQGWNEGLQLMKPGDKFLFVIPSELAYGQNPRPGGVIKPGDTLVFHVHLVKNGR